MRLYPQARKGQKHTERLELGNFATLNFQIKAIVNQFRVVKHESKPRFDSMYLKKLFCLLYLQAIQVHYGEFSGRDVYAFFLDNHEWAKKYFERLVTEGWVTQIQRPKARTTYLGILSPLSLEFIRLLRRRLEIVADEIDPNIPAMPRKNSKAFKEGVKNGTIDPVTRKFTNQRPKPYPDIEHIQPPSVIEEPIIQARVESPPLDHGNSSGDLSSDDLFSDISDTRN